MPTIKQSVTAATPTMHPGTRDEKAQDVGPRRAEVVKGMSLDSSVLLTI